MRIAVVTSCYNYGRFLPDWTDGLLAQTRRPDLVCIIDNGSDDDSPAAIERAAMQLRAAGLTVRTERIERADFGAARNAAVALADTEWVLYLDCDDRALPHLIEDVEELAPDADVVAVGWHWMPPRSPGRDVLHADRDFAGWPEGAEIPTGLASSNSAFRRALWEARPFRTDLLGGWDSAFWTGLAQIGARFVGTRRAGFEYRYHEDSVYRRRVADPILWARSTARIHAIRRWCRGVSVLVPRLSDDGGPRDQAWDWVRRRYEALHPGWEIVEGNADPFGRAPAINNALKRSRGEIVVVADADVFVAPAVLVEAVQLVASDRASWVVPHRLVHRLAPDETADVLEGPLDAEPGERAALTKDAYVGPAGGGLFVVRRAELEALPDGLPGHFRAWGGEDHAIEAILDTLIGRHTRLDGALWHLWHPPASRAMQQHHRQRVRFYHEAARRGPLAMWALLTRGPTNWDTQLPQREHTAYGGRKAW